VSVDGLLSLEGRVALVTGAAGGIGSVIVERLLGAGARVAAVDLPDKPAVERADPLDCDLASEASVDELFAEFRRRFDRLDILVHAAGITRDAVLWKMEAQAWRDVLRVNLESAFLVLKRAVPIMRSGNGGSVVLVSSINAERGKFGQANYAASKAGLIGLARSVARETGRFGIRVNVVAPGWIDTAMTAPLTEEVRAAAVEETALGALGEPDDVARAVWYLVSPMSRHVTGQLLRVDGGQLMA
jgi:NAD(P)-dependent dehydrogenase (short-subunit alcohol dehydrogenase family)